MNAKRLVPYLALAMGTCALIAYVLTLQPSFAFWDTGELQTVAAILGIAHPPACPAFVLLGWLFVHLLPFGEAAWRVNLMCAVAVAVSTGLVFAISRRFGLAYVTSAICTLAFAFADSTWTFATRAEVQDLELLFRVLALFFALRWLDSGTPRDLFLMALATGLAGATHGIAVFLLPALAIVLAAGRSRLDLASPAVIAGGLVLGLAPYVYLPLRSAWIAAHHLDPTVALGFPVGLAFWDYDHPATWPNFWRVVTAADYHVGSGFAGYLHFERYPDYAAALIRYAGAAYGLVGMLLAGIGACVLVASRRPERIAIVVAALLPIPYAEAYSDLQLPERYYLFAFWCAALAIGAGFEFVADLFRLTPRGPGRYIFFGILLSSFVAATPNRTSLFAQANDYWGPAYVAEVKTYVPDGSVILAEWAYSTPLAYAAYVDRSLGSRVVVASGPEQYLNDIPQLLQHHGVYVITFDPSLTFPHLKTRRIWATTYFAYRVTE